jgi:hypothetical protein
MQTKTDQEIEAEILAMQESIAKTYLQSPRDSQVSKNETLDQPETFLFTDEPTEQEAFELDIEEMDSSDQLVNFPPDSNQDDSMDLCSDALISPDQTSEESISLLSSLPTNMFQVS